MRLGRTRCARAAATVPCALVTSAPADAVPVAARHLVRDVLPFEVHRVEGRAPRVVRPAVYVEQQRLRFGDRHLVEERAVGSVQPAHTGRLNDVQISRAPGVGDQADQRVVRDAAHRDATADQRADLAVRSRGHQMHGTLLTDAEEDVARACHAWPGTG